MLASGPPKLAAGSTAKATPPTNQYDAVFYFNYLKNIKSHEDTTKGFTITYQNPSKDYLILGGEFDGYNILKLLKGRNYHFLLEQRTGCGPVCEQNSFKVFVFQNGALSEKSPSRVFIQNNELMTL